jgi:hypothetical protein
MTCGQRERKREIDTYTHIYIKRERGGKRAWGAAVVDEMFVS